MSYASQAAALGADLLTPRIRQALAGAMDHPAVANEPALQAAIQRQPERAVHMLANHLVANEGITVDSTDAEIDTAMVTTNVLTLMRNVYMVTAP